jgi:hypothetical protein
MIHGPLIETQRIHVPGTGTYVEIRQERSGTHLTYLIEHGSDRFGHRGTWGRDNVAEAARCMAGAITWNARHLVTTQAATHGKGTS